MSISPFYFEDFNPVIYDQSDVFIPITPLAQSMEDLSSFDPNENPFEPLYPVQYPPLHFVHAHQHVAACLSDIIHVLESKCNDEIYSCLADLTLFAREPDFREIPYEVRHKLMMEFEFMMTEIFPYTHQTLIESLRPLTHTALL
jgi:hypothetical protein